MAPKNRAKKKHWSCARIGLMWRRVGTYVPPCVQGGGRGPEGQGEGGGCFAEFRSPGMMACPPFSSSSPTRLLRQEGSGRRGRSPRIQPSPHHRPCFCFVFCLRPLFISELFISHSVPDFFFSLVEILPQSVLRNPPCPAKTRWNAERGAAGQAEVRMIPFFFSFFFL